MSFFGYFLTLTTYVNYFAEVPATLVSELGCHVCIHLKRVGFDIYIYIYIYIHTAIYSLLGCRVAD